MGKRAIREVSLRREVGERQEERGGKMKAENGDESVLKE